MSRWESRRLFIPGRYPLSEERMFGAASRTGDPRATQINSAQAPLEYGVRRRFCPSQVGCSFCVANSDVTCRRRLGHTLSIGSHLWRQQPHWYVRLTSQACHRTILSTRASGYGMCPPSRGVKTLSCSRETASTAMLPIARVPETHTTWPSRRQADRARDPTSSSFDTRVAFQCEDFEAGPSSHANCLPWPLESLSRRRSRHRRLAFFSTTSIGTLSSG
ncbi:hypothetical protein BD310DRAFT_941495 [Dichomitus squalens]|uniref:Uncharacterized protein n=1 Tax=Dichomitus squalens TaxID=114155 RepID=A0A4Q9PAW4_9APHY|nr:hypothetical protein BD310DRAFT_941495 [Dichomitus squalens]